MQGKQIFGMIVIASISAAMTLVQCTSNKGAYNEAASGNFWEVTVQDTVYSRRMNGQIRIIGSRICLKLPVTYERPDLAEATFHKKDKNIILYVEESVNRPSPFSSEQEKNTILGGMLTFKPLFSRTFIYNGYDACFVNAIPDNQEGKEIASLTWGDNTFTAKLTAVYRRDNEKDREEVKNILFSSYINKPLERAFGELANFSVDVSGTDLVFSVYTLNTFPSWGYLSPSLNLAAPIVVTLFPTPSNKEEIRTALIKVATSLMEMTDCQVKEEDGKFYLTAKGTLPALKENATVYAVQGKNASCSGIMFGIGLDSDTEQIRTIRKVCDSFKMQDK